MALARVSKVSVIDDALSGSPVDAAGPAPAIFIYLATGMLRLSAITALVAPLLLIAWLVL